jgi:hypothetical protein
MSIGISGKKYDGGELMKKNKAQAALEFLTTYGWAMLVLLVMIGALAYFGVLNVNDMTPEKCLFGAGIGCRDYAGIVTSNQVRAQLINSFGNTIAVRQVTIDSAGTATAPTQCVEAVVAAPGNGEWCNIIHDSEQWRSGETRELIVNYAEDELTVGSRPNIAVEITYRKAGSIYDKTVQGTIQVKPQ